MTAIHPLRSHLPVFVTALLMAIFAAPGLMLATAQTSGTADLAVTMTPSAKSLRYQESMTVEIVVTNLGPDTATGVFLATNEWDSVNPGPITCADGTIAEPWQNCPTVTLAPGESATYTWTVYACCTMNQRKIGGVSAMVWSDGTTVDPNPVNDFAQLDLRFIGKFPK